MIKKLTAISLALLLSLSVITACASPNTKTPEPTKSPEALEKTAEPTKEPTTDLQSTDVIRVASLKGPTTMGMVKLMQDAEDSKTVNKYEFTIGTTDEIVPKLIKGEVDIAAIPANLAATLYQNTKGAIQVLSINTLGVLYMVEKGDTIKTIADLKGKTIYSTGKGSTPEYVLNYILQENGIDPTKDVTIEYKSEATEIVALLTKGENAIALMPQPFVTTAMTKIPELKVVLDMTKEWDDISKDGSALVTGVVVARKEFLEKSEAQVNEFLKEYETSTKYANTNIDETAELVGKYGIVSAEIAKIAIPECNITYISGADMREKLEGYLTVLNNQNSQAIGGSLPDEKFYYIEKSN